MSKNHLSKEAETRLMNFFNTIVDPTVMAKAIRQLNYVVALGVMREHETLQNEISTLENSFYWLNERRNPKSLSRRRIKFISKS